MPTSFLILIFQKFNGSAPLLAADATSDHDDSYYLAGCSENLQHRQRLSHERVVATLRLRIRTLEEINRELKEQLEAVYGRLAVVQPKLGSCTERQNVALITCDPFSEAFRGT
jgi:hypothetical protein